MTREAFASALLLIGAGRNQKESLGKASAILAIGHSRTVNIFKSRAKHEPSEEQRARRALLKIADHQYKLAAALLQNDSEFFDVDISAALFLARQASALAE